MNDHSHMGLGAKTRTLGWITGCCAAILLILAMPLACTTLMEETPTPRPTYTPLASADAPETPDIDATVEARVAATIEAEASIETMVTTRLEATRAAEPSPTPNPTPLRHLTIAPQPTPSPTVAPTATPPAKPTATPTPIPLVTERRLEVGQNCDNILRNQLIFQRGASTADRMNVVIAQIQAQQQECAKNVWKPVAIDMSDTEGLCYKTGGGFTAATDGKALKVGDQALPESLQTLVISGQIPRYTSGRDSGNNIIVYWSDDTKDRPSDGASCWLYYSRLRSWHENYHPAASKPPPIPLVTEWSLTGNWYRNMDWEHTLTGVMKEIYPNMAYEMRVATLDATPGSEYTDLALTLACIGPAQAAYLMPYSSVLPEHVDQFIIGILNESKGEYLPDHRHTDYNPVLTDDRSSIYIANKAQLRQIMATLTHAAEKPQIDQYLVAGIGTPENENFILLSEFDPAGLHDALQYLGCFHDMGSTEQSAPPDLQNYAAASPRTDGTDKPGEPRLGAHALETAA